LAFSGIGAQDNGTNYLVARTDVEIVSAPPNGILCRSGSVVARIPAGARVQKLSDVNALCGPFLSRQYIKVLYQTTSGLITGYVPAMGDNGSSLFESAR